MSHASVPAADIALSKLLSLILRHRPGDFGLALDEEGFLSIADLLEAIREEPGRGVTEDDLRRIVAGSDKKRFEIVGDTIRACYGHTVAARIEYPLAEPPERLFHGTARASVDTIRVEGLRPMSRQFVHLSATVEVATRVGRRKDPKPALLTVAAARAHSAGVAFHRANDLIWLVRHLPPEFLSLPPTPDR